METKEIVKPKQNQTKTPSIRFFKTVFSHGISWDMNTLGKFVDRGFVESNIYSRYPQTTWIGETIEVPESEVPIKRNQLN